MALKITSAAVARLAGVSQSAVSRVFTPGASVSPETAEKVMAAADMLGYRPNVLARAMTTGKSRIIGLLVAYLENQFYPVALEILSRELELRGYHVLVFMADNDARRTARVVRELLGYQVDGIVAASVSITTDLAERCARAGIPVVLFNRGQDHSGHIEVTCDNVRGGREVARFLVAGGHTRVAHVAGWQGATTGRDRARGLAEGLALAGLEPVAVVDGFYRQDVAAAAARRLMEGPDPPDAIFVGNDHMALAVMDELRHRMGLRVPGDVSVVGFDDVPLAAWASYDLTTLRQPVRRMVMEAIELLLGAVEGRGRGGLMRIPGSLVVGGGGGRGGAAPPPPPHPGGGGGAPPPAAPRTPPPEEFP